MTLNNTRILEEYRKSLFVRGQAFSAAGVKHVVQIIGSCSSVGKGGAPGTGKGRGKPLSFLVQWSRKAKKDSRTIDAQPREPGLAKFTTFHNILDRLWTGV